MCVQTVFLLFSIYHTVGCMELELALMLNTEARGGKKDPQNKEKHIRSRLNNNLKDYK